MYTLLAQNLSPDATVGGFTIYEPVVILLTGALLPLATSFLMRPTMPSWVKVVLGGATAVLATLIAENVQEDGSAFVSYEFLLQAAGTWVVSVLAYLGAYKPATNGRLNEVTGPGLPIGPVDTPSEG